MPKKKIQKQGSKNIRKHRRIKYKNVFIFFLILCFLFSLIYICIHVRITNIYIYGNSYITDQEIIEYGNLQKYPSVVSTFSLSKKLKKNDMIDHVKIKYKNFTEIHLQITENPPLFFNLSNEKTILKDGKESNQLYDVPCLLNYIPDQKYKVFLKKIGKLSQKTIRKISEIKYDPNDKDNERFLISMNDGNYVYITLYTMEKLDSYTDIMGKMSQKFEGKHGILYLDSGQYFKVLEN